MIREYSAEQERHLQWLLELIQGRRWPFSQGLCSYDRPEPEHQALHQACLELERRGQLVRQPLPDGAMGWMPAEEASL